MKREYRKLRHNDRHTLHFNSKVVKKTDKIACGCLYRTQIKFWLEN